MSKTKFTPGPWKWSDNDYSHLKSQTPQPNVFSPTGLSLPTVMLADYEPIGYTSVNAFVVISDADAKLIEVSPELYDAAEAALECLQNNGFGKAYVEDLLKQVIAKARGEA